MSGEPDPYDILQVRADASEEVIRAAYRALARIHHPDMTGDPASAARMVLVNWAWEILSDPLRRARHDRERGLTHDPASAPPTAYAPDTGDETGAARGSPARSGRPPIQRRGADGRVIEWRNAPDGTGGAGEPPGRPSGTVLPFGRFIAWSIGEVARSDPGYLDWLDQRPEGAPYRDEIDATLRRLGWRQEPPSRDHPGRWGR